MFALLFDQGFQYIEDYLCVFLALRVAFRWRLEIEVWVLDVADVQFGEVRGW
jgi:hypothetical protein